MAVPCITLANGLRVQAICTPGARMAVVDVLYNVGSRDERRSLTGMAHLFEHLMFGGSVNVPSFNNALENAGGKSNAWTSPDFTNFYDILPAQNIETALFLESDRMLRLNFNQQSLDVQRNVVIEEFKQNYLNAPYGDVSHQLRRLAYAQEHPYSWPTIGLTPEHIASVSLEDVKKWFYSHYAPNNAILTVNSKYSADQVFSMARKWFGEIERRDISDRHLPEPGFPTEEIRETVIGRAPQPQVIVAYPMSGYGTPEYFAADTITDLLSYGRSGRFQKHLLEGPHAPLFTSADASIIGSEHQGLLLLTALVADSSDDACSEVENLLRNEIKILGQPGEISSEELIRTLNNFEATHRFSNVNMLSSTVNQAMALYHGEDPEVMIKRRRAITAQELERTAHQISNTPSITLIYKQ